MARYVLEHLIDGVGGEAAPEVRLQLLSSTVRLFFLLPPEVKRMLGRLLELEIGACGNSGTMGWVWSRRRWPLLPCPLACPLTCPRACLLACLLACPMACPALT